VLLSLRIRIKIAFLHTGQLWAMEVDPETALSEFRDLVKTAMGPPSDLASGGGGGMMGNIGLPDFKGEITEMLSG
jgi:anion-transporting  ArsA/GET3 family ATPase